jgi:hypothetical protein
MKLGLALRTMFRILGNKDFAQQIENLETDKKEEVKIEEKKPQRSEALTMVAALQREGRFLDFMMESLDSYSDAQIGAAVRDVHRDCAGVVKRMFAIEPLTAQNEGSDLEVPAGFDPAAYHLTGNLAGEAPYKGKIRHHGWKATKCDLPEWTGRDESVFVAAPIEVEL